MLAFFTIKIPIITAIKEIITFGVILGFLILNEAITPKVIISLIAVIIGIYIVKKGSNIKTV